MILTLAQVMSRATELAGGRTDFTASDVSFYANLALSEVAQIAGHKAKEALAVSSTTSGEGRYAWPSDFDYPIALTVFQASSNTTGSRTTSPVPLDARDANWIDAQSLTPAGLPTNYVHYADALELWPSPNSAYSLQLRYMTRHPTLVASNDTALLGERWHLPWLYKTAELLHAARGEAQGEALARNRYLNLMSTIPSDAQLVQRDRGSMTLRFGRGRR